MLAACEAAERAPLLSEAEEWAEICCTGSGSIARGVERLVDATGETLWENRGGYEWSERLREMVVVGMLDDAAG